MKQNTDDHAFVKWYVQHSKKLSTVSLAQWVVVVIAVIVLMLFHPVTSDEVTLLGKMIQWSATISVASVGGYMVNSAVEKACRQKIVDVIQEETGCSVDDEEDEESGAG